MLVLLANGLRAMALELFQFFGGLNTILLTDTTALRALSVPIDGTGTCVRLLVVAMAAVRLVTRWTIIGFFCEREKNENTQIEMYERMCTRCRRIYRNRTSCMRANVNNTFIVICQIYGNCISSGTSWSCAISRSTRWCSSTWWWRLILSTCRKKIEKKKNTKSYLNVRERNYRKLLVYNQNTYEFWRWAFSSRSL